jgi:hypothetical protein
MEPGWKCPDPWLAVSIAALRGQMSLAQTGAQACFTPYVTRPLPAKKSTKVGRSGFNEFF